MPDHPRNRDCASVDQAFAVLTEALKTEAVRGDFARTAAFLQHIERLQTRWTAGEPPHTPRTVKKPAASAPGTGESLQHDHVAVAVQAD